MEIETAIRSLPGGVPSFVILSKKKYEFMQTAGSVSEGFEIQFEEFSRDGLWEHGSRELPAGWEKGGWEKGRRKGSDLHI